MKKIIIIVPGLAQGGAEKQSITLAQLLKESGYEVELCCYTKDNFFEPILKEKGIVVNWLISNRIRRVLMLRNYIRHSNCYAVISFMDTPNFLNDFSAIGGKEWKVIGSIRGANLGYFKGLKAKVFNWFHRYTDFIVSNSYSADELCRQYLPQYKDKFCVIYNNIIQPKISSNYEPRKGGKTHFIIAASYSDRKNPRLIIEALSLMTKEERNRLVIDWYGHIIENGKESPLYNILISEIQLNKIGECFKLHDASSDIANLMNKADIVALVSKGEGLPNTIIEGMLIGKPVIMTNVSDYNYLVDETNGFVCENNNPLSLKQMLVNASNLSNKQLNDLGYNSKLKAQKLFSSDNTIKRWIDLIES